MASHDEQPTAGSSEPGGPAGLAAPDHRVFGLPWHDSYVLALAPDGTAAIADKTAHPYAWGVCAPGGFRRIAHTEPLHESTVYNALEAREWALGEPCCGCSRAESFGSEHLVLPRGPQWNEAVRTALLGDWTSQLEQGERVGPDVVGRIKSDAKAIHRQLVPVWRRRVRGSRVMLLESPLGEGLTLRDLVAGELRMADLVFESTFEDERIARVLARLTACERRIAMAWAHPSIATWTEAARFAGAAQPEAAGERVRRKLKRIGSRYVERSDFHAG